MRKIVLITGASSGIGKETAIYLDSLGYDLVLVARNKEKLTKLGNVLRDPLIITYDLNNLADIETIFENIKKLRGKLDGLLHCAGINRDQPVKVNNVEDMIGTVNVNLLSFIQLARFFCAKKYSNDNSAIIAMSSIAAISCDKSMCTYSASKAGIDAAVKVMSKEFAKRKIRVNSIQPTFVDTPMVKDMDDYIYKAKAQPLGVIQPINIAYLIEFLLSDKARFISGSNIKMSSAIM